MVGDLDPVRMPLAIQAGKAFLVISLSHNSSVTMASRQLTSTNSIIILPDGDHANHN